MTGPRRKANPMPLLHWLTQPVKYHRSKTIRCVWKCKRKSPTILGPTGLDRPIPRIWYRCWTSFSSVIFSFPLWLIINFFEKCNNEWTEMYGSCNTYLPSRWLPVNRFKNFQRHVILMKLNSALNALQELNKINGFLESDREPTGI